MQARSGRLRASHDGDFDSKILRPRKQHDTESPLQRGRHVHFTKMPLAQRISAVAMIAKKPFVRAKVPVPNSGTAKTFFLFSDKHLRDHLRPVLRSAQRVSFLKNGERPSSPWRGKYRGS
jgi:hypothetical protein